MRFALIDALKHAIAPLGASFARLWPEAVLAHLPDDSLSAGLARDGALTPAMEERFLTLARYAAATGAACFPSGPVVRLGKSERLPA